MKLFRKRLSRQWQFNLTIFKSIADWTVWVYLCIPAALFSYFLYRETIMQKQFGLLEWVPFEVFLFVLFYFLQMGIIRSFLEPADQLFLIQQKAHWRKLLVSGLIYSLSLQILFNVLVLGLLFLVFIHLYHLTVLEIMLIFCLSVTTYLWKQFIVRTDFREWFQTILQLLLPLLMTALFLVVPTFLGMFISCAIIALLLALYIQRYVLRHHSFDKLLRVDRAQYYLLVGTVFSLSKELQSMKAPKETGQKPRYFTKRIIQDEVVELIVKTFIRNKTYKWAYLRLIGITLFLYFVLPFWAQILLVIATHFMLKGYTNSVITEMREHPIHVIFQISDERWNAAQLIVKSKLIRSIMVFVIVYFIAINLVF
ncbi:ABC transporter permease [Solibacillus cecembensis]|uniref:ABC transporter permease n=1 Tax=Solibacillus cecembensis TaxID=459347 RepID=UPI003CFCD460